MTDVDHDLEWNDCLQDGLDGELDPAEQASFDTHVASCPRCQTRLKRLESLDQALQNAAPPVSLDASFDARLFAKIDDVDETRRAAARERVQSEMQLELQLLARNWRRTLGVIVPGIIAGIALAFSLAAYFDTSELMRTLVAESASDVGSAGATFIHMLLTSMVGAAIGYTVARWLTPAAN